MCAQCGRRCDREPGTGSLIYTDENTKASKRHQRSNLKIGGVRVNRDRDPTQYRRSTCGLVAKSRSRRSPLQILYASFAGWAAWGSDLSTENGQPASLFSNAVALLRA